MDAALDPERVRLIGSLYETLLRPEHFDTFMRDWSSYVAAAASDSAGSAALADPAIESHFRRVFALFERMGRGEASAQGRVPAPVPLLRLMRAGRVRDAQAEAEALFGRPATLEGVFAALEPASGARLRDILGSLERAPVSGRFAVLCLEAGVALQPEGLPGGGLIAAVTCRDPAGDGFVIELRPLSISWAPGLGTLLAESFALTPREIDLVRELMRGGDLPAIAARVGRSQNTLRAHLKSIFAKTRSNTQPELVRLVSTLLLHGLTEADPHLHPPPAEEERRIDLADGRFLPVHLVGAEDGLPVVFVHGMLDGLGALRVNARAIAEAGLRVIAPVRANFGQALPDPRVQAAPELFARDLEAALDRLGIERCVLVGHMGGSVSAFAAAARLGVRAAALVSVSGCVPIRSTAQFAQMSPRQRAMAYTARYAPALLPAIVRAAIARVDRRDVARFMASLYPREGPDRAVVADLDCAAAIAEGYRFSVAQGPAAFQIDAWHVTRDWSDLAARSTCPVTLIHASRDPVISLSSVREFANTGARYHVHEIPDAGQLVFYARPREVLQTLRDVARGALSGA